MKTIINFLVALFIWIVVGIVLMVVIFVTLNKSEKIDCYKLQKQSEHYPDFYLTQDEKTMCDGHGIDINAPVR